MKMIHPVAGALALFMIATCWLSTALTELFASQAIVTTVKTAIPWGFLVRIPALVAAGGSGFALAKGRRGGVIGAKAKRMPLIAANGILVLIPCALFLALKARAAEFDTGFYAVQALELTAGAANIVMLGLNMRDGLKMKGRLRRQPAMIPRRTSNETLIGTMVNAETTPCPTIRKRQSSRGYHQHSRGNDRQAVITQTRRLLDHDDRGEL